MNFFRWPQDVMWVSLCIISIICLIISCVFGNWIPILISSLSFVAYIIAFIFIKFIPWYKTNNKIKFKFRNITVCSYRNFENIEKKYIEDSIDYVLVSLQDICNYNCILDKAFRGSFIFFVNEIDEKTFNMVYGTSYKKLSGYAKNKTCVVELNDDITLCALKHELCHIILNNCSGVIGSQRQHEIMFTYAGC